MQKVKGSVLKSRIDFIREHFGDEGVEKVLTSLSPEDEKAMRNVLPAQWFEFEVGKRFDDAIVQELGGGKAEFFERLGAASAEINLTGVHRVFLTPGDPAGFLAKAPQIYRLYYQTGRRAYDSTGPNSGTLTTHEAETFSAPDCLTVIGWYRKALEMCGAKGIEIVEEECRAQGGEVCRYRVAWS